MPRRPDHPDFRILSRILISSDSQAEQGTPVLDMIGRVVNPDVIVYVAGQRSLRMLMHEGAGAGSAMERGRLASVWLDGFMAGAAFQAHRDRQEPS